MLFFSQDIPQFEFCTRNRGTKLVTSYRFSWTVTGSCSLWFCLYIDGSVGLLPYCVVLFVVTLSIICRYEGRVCNLLSAGALFFGEIRWLIAVFSFVSGKLLTFSYKPLSFQTVCNPFYKWGTFITFIFHCITIQQLKCTANQWNEVLNDKLIFGLVVEKSPASFELEYSLLCSPNSVTGPSPEPGECMSHPHMRARARADLHMHTSHTVSLIYILILSSRLLTGYLVVPSFQVFWQKVCVYFLAAPYSLHILSTSFCLIFIEEDELHDDRLINELVRGLNCG